MQWDDLSLYMGEAWHFGFLQHFRKYFEAQKFSFSVDPADPNSNTNTFVLFPCYKINYLCIWGKLDILASFNISGNILRPKSFPLAFTLQIRSQIPTLLFCFSAIRLNISLYGVSLTFRLPSKFQEIFWPQKFSFSSLTFWLPSTFQEIFWGTKSFL